MKVARISMRAGWAAVPVLLLGLGGCAYEPPVVGDRSSDKYHADLDACQMTTTEAVRLNTAKTLRTWLISPFTGPSMREDAMRSCMEAKGYKLNPASG